MAGDGGWSVKEVSLKELESGDRVRIEGLGQGGKVVRPLRVANAPFLATAEPHYQVVLDDGTVNIFPESQLIPEETP